MSDKFRVIIVDDEKESIDLLTDILKEKGEIEILDSYNDPVKGIEGILRYKPDLLFLDIQMPGKSGFEVLKEVQSSNYNPVVIFITGFDRFAIQAIKQSAFDYLLKPVDLHELELTLQRLEKKDSDNLHNKLDLLLKQVNNNKKLRFNTRTGFIVLDSSEIIYCLADRNYTEIFLVDGRKEVITNNLKQVSKSLSGKEFFRASRSLMININFLIKAERTKREIILKNGGDVYSFSIPIEKIRELEVYN